MSVTLLNGTHVESLHQQAKASDRLRSHHNFHHSSEEPVQRLSIALQPNTYVRPHRHIEAHQWEMMILLTGEVHVLVFSDDGVVIQRQILSQAAQCYALELAPNTWHSVLPIAGEASILEVKQGPYRAANPEDVFAKWAPEEFSDGVKRCLKWMYSAAVGDKY